MKNKNAWYGGTERQVERCSKCGAVKYSGVCPNCEEDKYTELTDE